MEKIRFYNVKFSADRALTGLMAYLDRISEEGHWDGNMKIQLYVDKNNDFCVLEGSGREKIFHASYRHWPEEIVYPSNVEECTLREFSYYAYIQWILRRHGIPPV